jgi:sulfotransferase
LFSRINFISGLPRSGSTLLAAILRQNPRFHAAMTSPVGQVFGAALAAMGAENEFAVFFNDAQKRQILTGVFEGYYAHLENRPVVFDTNRVWTSRLSALRQLFPELKMICCVRNPAWIMDSIEQLIRKNAFDVSRIFVTPQERATVYSRAEALLNQNRMIGFAWSALREAYFGADADHMLLVDYDILASRPKECIDLIYSFIDEKPFPHDFENVSYEAQDFDMQLVAPGLHTVTGKVELKPRRTVLPPDLFKRCQDLIFWDQNKDTKAFSIVNQPT